MIQQLSFFRKSWKNKKQVKYKKKILESRIASLLRYCVAAGVIREPEIYFRNCRFKKYGSTYKGYWVMRCNQTTARLFFSLHEIYIFLKDVCKKIER